MRAIFPVLAVALASSCRVHTLEDGAYSFTKVEVTRDDCGLANQPEVFGRGVLLKAGHQVRLNYSYLNAELTGTYRYGLEEFTADGVLATTRVTLRGQECLVDSLQISLDAVTQSSRRFSGSMSFSFQSRAAESCTCRVFFRYDALFAGG